MVFRNVFLFASLIGLLGCVTKAKQTNNLFKSSPQNISDFQEIKTIPFLNQSQGYCGPATLTMAMRWAGENISIQEAADLVYTPGYKGSLQSDMISACRRRGLMAIPIDNLEDLLTEVSENHPVIVFENLSVSWAPQWHYALDVGYDLKKQEIIMHSGHEAFYHWDLEKFERSWMLGDYWGLVVLPAGSLSATGDELAHLKATVGIEMANRKGEALVSYKKILEKWPTSYVGLMGLANLEYQMGNYKKAIQIFQRVIELYPKAQAARHNLSIAESTLDRAMIK